MKPGREVIEVNLPEWQALLERARQEPLDEEGYESELSVGLRRSEAAWAVAQKQ
jgi:hypothetical protein